MQNLALLAIVAALAAAPLFIHRNGGAEFGGADNRAQNLITEIRPDYQPWFTPIWEPPSGEVASLLFSLQAALGAGLIGFYFGRRSARGDRQEKADKTKSVAKRAA